MAITGIDTLDGKQIIAAGASSAVKAAQDGNGNIITATYQTTAGMSNYQTTWGMTGYATTASVTGKQDALTFSYTDGQISLINGSAIYSQGGGAFPYTGNVQEALNKVYTDSATWDNVSAKEDTLTFDYTDGKISKINNSAIYSQGGGTSYTGNVQEALDKVYTDSATWDNVSAKQDTLTFNYDGSNNITGINSSAIAGGVGVVTATGGNGTYVTSINEMPLSGAGGGAGVVSSTGGNGTYVTAINEMPLSGAVYYPSFALKHATNEGYKIFTQNGLNIGDNIRIKFNPGTFMTNYNTGPYSIAILKLASGQYSVTANFSFNGVQGPQWTAANDAFTITGGNIANGPHLFNCFSEWGGEPWVQLRTESRNSSALSAINREIRNSPTADNNSLYISFNTIITANS